MVIMSKKYHRGHANHPPPPGPTIQPLEEMEFDEHANPVAVAADHIENNQGLRAPLAIPEDSAAKPFSPYELCAKISAAIG